MENRVPKYINPFTDFGFKKIFGEEANKDLLIDFLNELLKAQNEQIKDLIFKKSEHLGKSGLDRNVVFDLFCENEAGGKFTVELQKAKQAFFKDRMLYYSSYSIQEQGIKGDWNYKLNAVYVIGILDFIIDEDQAEQIVVRRIKLLDTERYDVFYDKLTFITIQMPNFNKRVEELETNFDRWLYVIKNLNRLDNIPERLKTKIFEKLFKVANYATLSAKERDAYEESLKYYNDLKNSLDTAFDDGKKEGIEETAAEYAALVEEERRQKEEERRQKEEERRQKEEERRQKEEERRQKEEERRQKEEERRQKEEAQQNLTEIVKYLLSMNIPVEEIAQKTKMPEEEIRKLMN